MDRKKTNGRIMKNIKITLLGKALSTQHAYGLRVVGKFPIKYMTKDAKYLKESYVKQASEQYSGPILEEDIEMDVSLYFPDRRRRDVDNYHKLSLDSLEEIVYKNDVQIVKMTIEKFIDKKNPRIEIIINKLKRAYEKEK